MPAPAISLIGGPHPLHLASEKGILPEFRASLAARFSVVKPRKMILAPSVVLAMVIHKGNVLPGNLIGV